MNGSGVSAGKQRAPGSHPTRTARIRESILWVRAPSPRLACSGGARSETNRPPAPGRPGIGTGSSSVGAGAPSPFGPVPAVPLASLVESSRTNGSRPLGDERAHLEPLLLTLRYGRLENHRDSEQIKAVRWKSDSDNRMFSTLGSEGTVLHGRVRTMAGQAWIGRRIRYPLGS
jgi:hypothetical protein